MTVVVFSSCLKLSLLELFLSILSPMSHSFFLILLSCYLFVLSFVDLGTLFGPSSPLIVSFLSVKACSPLSRIFPFLCTIRIVTCSSLVNHSWFLLVLGWRIGVHWRCKFKFLLDGLCLLAVWRRVVLVCLPAVLMVEEGTSLVLAWKLHLQWLEDVILQPWLFMVSRDIVGSEPLIDDVCLHKNVRHDVVASRCLVLVDDVWAGLFEDDGSRRILANTRWVAPCVSSAS